MTIGFYQIIGRKDEETQQRHDSSLKSLLHLNITPHLLGHELSKSQILNHLQSSLEDNVSFICLLDDDIIMKTFPEEKLLHLLQTYDIIVPFQEEDNRHWNILHFYDSEHYVYRSHQNGAFAYGCAIMTTDVFLSTSFHYNQTNGYGLDDRAFHLWETALCPEWVVIHPWESDKRREHKRLSLQTQTTDRS